MLAERIHRSSWRSDSPGLVYASGAKTGRLGNQPAGCERDACLCRRGLRDCDLKNKRRAVASRQGDSAVTETMRGQPLPNLRFAAAQEGLGNRKFVGQHPVMAVMP